MNVILIVAGSILGAGLLTIIGCCFYWHEEDKEFDRKAAHTIAYWKNFCSQQWCLDAIDRALADALFWNDLSKIYIEAGLFYEARTYYSMSYDILEGVTGRNIKPINYIPRRK